MNFTKANKLKVLQTPHIEGLRTIGIIDYARTQFNIDEYLSKFKNKKNKSDWSLCWALVECHTLKPLVISVAIEKIKKFVIENVNNNNEI